MPSIIIEALNVGMRPVEIRRAGFLKPDGSEVQPPVYYVEPCKPPYLLTDGMSMRFHFRSESGVPADRSFEVSHAFVDGGPGRRWRGKPDAWLRPVRIAKRWPYA